MLLAVIHKYHVDLVDISMSVYTFEYQTKIWLVKCLV